MIDKTMQSSPGALSNSSSLLLNSYTHFFELLIPPELNINELFQEAKNRWLKPAEIVFILETYDKDQLTQEPPQNPQSGSLFLFNRKVNRFFRKDGLSWRKKKDGRTVGEAHERLKVRGVEALNCYYAHGEPNSSFQRRCYWLLNTDKDHIVLVHYREISEANYPSRSTANLSIDSGSPFNLSATVYDMQNLAYPSGVSELPGPYETSLSLRTLDEDCTNVILGNNEMCYFDAQVRSEDIGSTSESEAWTFRKLTEQLSLDDDDQFAEELPQQWCRNENSKDSGFLTSESDITRPEAFVEASHGLEYREHDQLLDGYGGLHDDLCPVLLLQNSGDAKYQCGPPPSQGFKLEKKGSLSSKDMLASYSTSTAIDMQKEDSDALTLKGFSETSTFEMVKVEDGYCSQDVPSHDHYLAPSEMDKIFLNSAQELENFTCQWQENGRSNADTLTKFFPTSESNNNLQLSAARHFPLGPENGILSETSSEPFQELGKSTPVDSSRASSLEAISSAGILGKTSIEWLETGDLPVNNNLYSPDYYHYHTLLHQENHFRTRESNVSCSTSQVQRFRIQEISPEWAYSTEDTKVIIVGDFLCNPSDCAWACMFGDIEVSLEIVQAGVFRCRAPQHVAGKVALCITSGNKEPCSEQRVFEYRSKPKSSASEELKFLVRFVEMLLHGDDSPSEVWRISETADGPWGRIRELLRVGSETQCTVMDCLLQELLKDKLQQWLSSKFPRGGGMGFSLSKQQKGIIHLIAGLGYEWALSMILDAEVSINFRDSNGWTALHWAACFRREKMVAALLAAGASAEAVTDPTPQCPAGKNPAAIAAENGHKGLAGYLSESALTSHLLSLTLEESESSKCSAAVDAEKIMKSFEDVVSTIEDEHSLPESLAAARNVSQAAARIQAAFRAHSFRKRQLSAAGFDANDMSRDDIVKLSSILKLQRAFRHRRDYRLNNAAVSIQKKYRGWIRRKEFLTLKRNVVKIQAHVRGYQVRKKYKELLWMVGVLEKAILRWRRGGVGLRGFRTDTATIDGSEDVDILKVFRKQKVDAIIEEAVSRVLSMVECSDARQQYRRILEKYRQAKAELIDNPSAATPSYQGSGDDMEKGDDVDVYHHS